ncbi:CitMHS family transporter [Virgibacillus necropolis]|uniref:Citrate transporter n=1 Tax=Virgibacillus necropolis TaxID=163877 RepID=A0A221MB07_9BACI|nr:citrate:proton symporter [Virgibacillus necropolis]ASN04858.1 citrate transporter [Virgibacillus necropolis]
MLALLGFLMIIVFMYLIMTKRLSALIALMVIPVVFALLGGFTEDIGQMMLDGVSKVAPTGIMIMFAILYFGVMIDAGLFDPVVEKIIRVVKGDPLKVAMGTACLILFVSLDGDGTTAYMITVSAMLPLYKRIGMNPLVLAGIAVLGSGVMNLLPWGGPTARAMSVLGLGVSELFVPVLPAMLGGVLVVLGAAFYYGKKERKRLGVIHINQNVIDEMASKETAAASEAVGQDESIKRPKLIWVNFLLTILLLVCLVVGVLPTPVLFMIAFAVAIMINYPNMEQQKERISTYAGNVLSVVSLVFAAGVFTGILTGTEMVDAMANSLISVIPDAWGQNFAVITAIASAPFTFFMSNDAFYFGVLPVLAETASTYGVSPVEVGRASLLGLPVHLLSPLVPSTYLLVGMAGVEFGDLQKMMLKWAALATLVMTVVAVVLGII